MSVFACKCMVFISLLWHLWREIFMWHVSLGLQATEHTHFIFMHMPFCTWAGCVPFDGAAVCGSMCDMWCTPWPINHDNNYDSNHSPLASSLCQQQLLPFHGLFLYVIIYGPIHCSLSHFYHLLKFFVADDLAILFVIRFLPHLAFPPSFMPMPDTMSASANLRISLRSSHYCISTSALHLHFHHIWNSPLMCDSADFTLNCDEF